MEVIYLEFEKGTSFAWSNGLYAIAKVGDDNTYHLAKIGDDGMIEKYSDGKPDISITGINNVAIKRTSLVCNEHIDYN